jgi:hypothetical protein
MIYIEGYSCFFGTVFLQNSLRTIDSQFVFEICAMLLSGGACV